MVVLIMMGFGLLMMGENKEGEKPAPESVTE